MSTLSFAKRPMVILTIIVVIAAAIGYWLMSKPSGPAGMGAGGMPPTVVTTADATTQKWQQAIAATGSLKAENGIVLRNEVSGRVTAIYFHSGDAVKTGQALIQLNPAVLNAELAIAKSQRKLSKSEFDQAEELFRKKAWSKKQYDEAQAKLESSTATVAKTKAELAQLHITAPFNGRLGLRQISVGDYLAAGTGIVNLQSLDPMSVDFSLPQIYLNQVNAGDPVSIYSRSHPQKKFHGKVIAMDSLVDADTRSINVRASIANQHKVLLPGTFVEVNLLVGKPVGRITVPHLAIVYSPQGDYVYRLIKGHAIKTLVKLGQQRANDIAITAGLKQGETVITAGQLKIYDGAKVMLAKHRSPHKK